MWCMRSLCLLLPRAHHQCHRYRDTNGISRQCDAVTAPLQPRATISVTTHSWVVDLTIMGKLLWHTASDCRSHVCPPLPGASTLYHKLSVVLKVPFTLEHNLHLSQPPLFCSYVCVLYAQRSHFDICHCNFTWKKWMQILILFKTTFFKYDYMI